MRAFITGVTGQDGSWLAEQLLAQGQAVFGLVRRTSSGSSPRIAHLHDLVQIGGDVTDPASLVHALSVAKPTHVFNLAAQSSVADSFMQPTLTASVVALGAGHVLDAVRRCCPDARVYQASSSEMFGNSASPQGLHSVFHPRSPYAAAKVHAHHLAINARESYGLHVVCGILFNHESDRRGPDFVTRHIAMGVARIVRELQVGRANPLPLGNLDARRDWGWAPDYTRAMQQMLDFPVAREWCIATGESHSVREFAAAAFAEVGLDWRDHVVSDASRVRPCEVPDLRGDPTEAQALLGWQPTVTFAGIVQRMVRAELDREIV